MGEIDTKDTVIIKQKMCKENVEYDRQNGGSLLTVPGQKTGFPNSGS